MDIDKEIINISNMISSIKQNIKLSNNEITNYYDNKKIEELKSILNNFIIIKDKI
jgi:hypothetical protein